MDLGIDVSIHVWFTMYIENVRVEVNMNICISIMVIIHLLGTFGSLIVHVYMHVYTPSQPFQRGHLGYECSVYYTHHHRMLGECTICILICSA